MSGTFAPTVLETTAPTVLETIAPTVLETIAPTVLQTVAENVTAAPSAAATTEPMFSLGELMDEPSTILVAFSCAAAAILISGWNIFSHLINYNAPNLQKSIVRILFMIPLYAAFSFLSLSFSKGHEIIDTVRDLYEAFVVYCFLNLMLAYCGGENACLSVIMHSPGSISHVFPLNYCLPGISLNARFLRLCKQGTLQFVIVKPVMALLNLLFLETQNGPTAWGFIQAVVYNVSYTLALYMLVLFYKATHNHPGLKSQYPVLKFASVKLVVFATYYQTVLISILPNETTSVRTLELFNNFLLCCEMVVFAVLQFWAFNWKEFREGRGHDVNESNINTNNYNSGGGHDVELPVRSPGSPSRPGNQNDVAMANAKDIISINDVAKDAYYNFSKKYGDHVMLDSEGEHLDIDLQSDTSAKEDSTKKKGAFGAISSKLNSLRTGVSLAGNMDEDQGAGFENPFEAASSTLSPGRNSANLEEDSLQSPTPFHDAELQANARTAVHEGEPSNPFDIVTSRSSFERADSEEATAAPKEADPWTAEFSSAPSTQGKKSKKKKKAKKPEPSGDTNEVALI